MRISDWSSDVCSSDLRARLIESLFIDILLKLIQKPINLDCIRASYVEEFALISNERTRQDFAETVLKSGRSEERRVGKECVSKCSSRGSPYHEKKTKSKTNRRILGNNANIKK